MSPSKYTTPDAHSIPLLSDTHPDDEERQPLESSPHPLYPPVKPPRRPVLNRYSWIVAATLLLIFIGLLAIPKPGPPQPPGEDDVDFEDGYDETGPIPDVKGICAQPTTKALPEDELSRALASTLESEEFLRESVERLSGAVQCRTESFDDMGPVGKDPRWEVFRGFHEFLKRAFPRV
jgi:Gly-Xaa carboxypeptidase